MRKTRPLLPFLLALLPLPGCQVPDIKPFSSATVEVTSAVSVGLTAVLGDLAAAASLDLAPAQQAALRQQRDLFARQVQAHEQALTTLNQYAGALVEVSEAGDQGRTSLTKMADALAGIAGALGPTTALGGAAVAQGVQAIAGDVQKIRTLRKLNAAMTPADDAIQAATNLLQANLKSFARLDSAVGSLVEAQLRGTNQNVLQAYADLRERQDRADSLTSLLVLLENNIVAFKRASGERRARYQQRLTGQLASLAQADEELADLLPFSPTRLKKTLAQANRREAFWRQRADGGISPALQARYDKVLAALARNEARTAQHAAVLRKSGALLGAWAAAHTTLKRAVTDQRHAVSFQEVIEGAKKLQRFIDGLPTSSATTPN